MRCAYIVTSHLSGEPNVRSAPVLGVHTSPGAAAEHFKLCRDTAASKPGSSLCWDMPLTDEFRGGGRVTRAAYVRHSESSYTTLQLEQWQLSSGRSE